MELLEGRLLRNCITGHPLEPAVTVSLAIQIADALEAVHAVRIIHRDIKPSNLIVTQRGCSNYVQKHVVERPCSNGSATDLCQFGSNERLDSVDVDCSGNLVVRYLKAQIRGVQQSGECFQRSRKASDVLSCRAP